MSHDPSQYIRQLQQILISDKKKIAFLFGAGTSLKYKNANSLIPATDKITESVVSFVIKDNCKYQKAIEAIKAEIGNGYNIETLLSNLEQKRQIICDNELNGLKKSDFSSLIGNLKVAIKQTVDVEISDSNDLIQTDFSEWIERANRKYGIEIFTTNYDYLFELGLEQRKIPFYDGFTGSYAPFFNPDSVEDMEFIPRQTKLWKIHGSLGWYYEEKSKKICRGNSSNDQEMLIYPSAFKYNESRKQPYIAFTDRLVNFLKQPDTVLITCGYSFRDEHINERIVTAVNGNSSGNVFALFYDKHKVDDEDKKENEDKYLLDENHPLVDIAKSNRKISVYGCRKGIIGGQLRQWKLKNKTDVDEDINRYFYVDKNQDEKENTGSLTITTFSKFVQFLESMILKEELDNNDLQ